MYDIIKNIIEFHGSQTTNIDSTILNICTVLIPMFVVYFTWCFTKIIAYIVNFGRK